MRDYVIMTDSSCDLPERFINENNIIVVPMGIVIDGIGNKHYHDYREMSIRSFYNSLKSGKQGSTSGVNMQDAIDAMRSVALANKDIVFLSISSSLSGSFNNVRLAANEVADEFNNISVFVIDTKAVSAGVGLMVKKAVQLKNNGMPIDDIVNELNTIAGNVHHSFTVDDLSYLQKSGRISHLTLLAGSALGIKPIFSIDESGKVKNSGKVRGKISSIRHLAKSLPCERENKMIAICHADSIDDALSLKDTIINEHPHADIMICDIGPIIGMNTGIGTLGVMSI